MQYPKWTKEEIENYNRNYKRRELGPAYFRAGIKNNDPGRRLSYLIKKLNISEREQEEILKKMKESEDKGFILGRLEERAMLDFF